MESAENAVASAENAVPSLENVAQSIENAVESAETAEESVETAEESVETAADSVINTETPEKDEQTLKNEAMENAENEANAASKYADNPMFKAFVSKKLYTEAAERLVELCEKLNMTTEDFDDRAVELLASFNLEQTLYIIKELDDSQLYGVHNKPQYLMSVMRNFKDRVRSVGSVQAMSTPLIPGPNTENVKALIERTGYNLEVTVGQRKFHNPPDHDNTIEPSACIYIGQIPRDLYEDELIPQFETIGKIFDLRLMMDPSTGKSRGYAFLIYCNKEDAQEAAKKFDGYEIQPGKSLKVNVSVANTRLFIGNIPKSKSKEEILEELQKHAENVNDVIIYANPEAGDARKNRGFCFVDFADHKAASDAKRRISQGKIRPWNNDLVVDWAERQDEPDDEVMATVKVVYVKNLKESVTEERLKELFENHGEVERAKKIRDYAFIHFKEREGALAAIEALKGTVLDDLEIDISLAKPQGDMKQKKKLAQKRGPTGPGANSLASRRSGPGYGGGDYYSGGGYNSRGRSGPAYPKYPASGGYPGAAGYGPPGYDPYGFPNAPYYPPVGGAYDPYGPPAYDAYSGYGGGYAPPPAAGARNGGGYGGKSKGSFGRGGGGGGGGGGGRGRNGSGRGKRQGGPQGGPASKRTQDFSADVSMNMF